MKQDGDPAPAAVLGLGEAGARYAADLVAAGWPVVGYDPAPTSTPDGVVRAHSIAEAVREAELVLSFTGEPASATAAASAGGSLPPGARYADFNTSAPATKRAVEQACSAPVADVAVLAPVPREGARTPLIASGEAAADLAAALRPVGASVEVLGEPVGAAAGRKLLRSVFMKGLAAAAVEADTAGAAAGCQDWIREQMAAELGPRGPELVERLIGGTRAHAGRRVHEMRASHAHLDELGVPAPVVEASLRWLRELSEGREAPERKANP